MKGERTRKKILNGTIYKSPRYKAWRKRIFTRDDFRCRWCTASKGTYIEAHHIKPKSKFPKLMYNVRNGVTLCLPCHKKVTRNELKYVAFFKQLIKNKVVKVRSKKKKNRHIKRILK